MGDKSAKVAITHHPQGAGGRYVAEVAGAAAPGALVERLVEDAAAQGFLIRPDCSYVAAKFAANPEWDALRA